MHIYIIVGPSICRVGCYARTPECGCCVCSHFANLDVQALPWEGGDGRFFAESGGVRKMVFAFIMYSCEAGAEYEICLNLYFMISVLAQFRAALSFLARVLTNLFSVNSFAD